MRVRFIGDLPLSKDKITITLPAGPDVSDDQKVGLASFFREKGFIAEVETQYAMDLLKFDKRFVSASGEAKCEICGKKFTDDQALSQHRGFVHKIKKEKQNG